ncbi:MAG: YbaK/EbsC family protein [Nitrososphaeria archaeon]|nr:YbaK/EbsC family protein [Nitrososphaeria archaeon]
MRQLYNDKDLQAYIKLNYIDAEILYFKEHVMTVDAAAENLKISTEYIIKSILVLNERNEPFLIILNGDKKVSFDKVMKITDSKNIRLAKAKEVKEILGYEVGSVPPIFHKNSVKVFIDERVLKYDYVIGGGGSTHSLLKIRPKDIINLTKAQVYDISE